MSHSESMGCNGWYKMKANVIEKPSHLSWARDVMRDDLALTKPTITLLVALTVVPSLFIATNGAPNLAIACLAIVGASLASASAAVFNQIVETDLDIKMKRTQSRSIAAGRVSKEGGIAFGLVLGLLGGFLLSLCHPTAALVALAGHLFYVLVYTLYLKRRTVQNLSLIHI